MSNPKFNLGQRVRHTIHRAGLIGTITEALHRPDHPAYKGWWYVVDVDGRPDRMICDRTFAEVVLRGI